MLFGRQCNMLDLKQIESFYPEHLRPFKRNLLREYLQYKILESIYGSKFLDQLIFMGGTAIHIAHGNTRFSEDLDFDNVGLTQADFENLSMLIQKKMGREGYPCEIKNTLKNTYHSHIYFRDILFTNGLSPHRNESLLIKIDTEPQHFTYDKTQITLSKFDVFTKIHVVPIDMLLAQKICAIFTRKRSMGRDFYDVLFLMGKTKPSFKYLKEKLRIQNQLELTQRLIEKCARLNFQKMSQDVRPFLFNADDAKKILLFPDVIKTVFK